MLQLFKYVWSAGDGLPQCFAITVAAYAFSIGIAVAIHRLIPKAAVALFDVR